MTDKDIKIEHYYWI